VDAIEKPVFRLIVGLGNPGREYAKTRHNVGFMILDKLAARSGVSFQASRKWDAETASHGGVHFCKPTSYMNLSGEPVAAISQFYKVLQNEILVVLDDVALPLGKLRMRLDGSAGGHNGLRSVIEHLGTKSVPRLRVGIGAAEGAKALTDHVLGRFEKSETAALEESLDRAVAAIELAQSSGAQTAMNHFNQTQN
jgi:PTH1 family peptidyl-tRNA hydrolase